MLQRGAFFVEQAFGRGADGFQEIVGFAQAGEGDVVGAGFEERSAWVRTSAVAMIFAVGFIVRKSRRVVRW